MNFNPDNPPTLRDIVMMNKEALDDIGVSEEDVPIAMITQVIGLLDIINKRLIKIEEKLRKPITYDLGPNLTGNPRPIHKVIKKR